MNDLELEEHIKEKFESVMDKLARLIGKHKEVAVPSENIIFLEIVVLNVFTRTKISVKENEKHKWTRFLHKLGHLNCNNNGQFINLKEAFDFMEETDKLLETHEGLVKLVNNFKKGL